jgi:hypothetical protein
MATRRRPGYVRRVMRGPTRWTAEDEEVYREFLAGLSPVAAGLFFGGPAGSGAIEEDEDGD